MDNEKMVKKSKKFVTLLFSAALVVVGIFVVGLLYLESQSPAQVFINDTDAAVSTYLLGGTSPGVPLNVAPGKLQVIDMPFWWGTETLPRNDSGERVVPRWNFAIVQIYYLSDFPKNW